MKIIHRYSLDINEVSEAKYSIFGSAAKINWKPLNQITLMGIQELAIHDGDNERLKAIKNIANRLGY